MVNSEKNINVKKDIKVVLASVLCMSRWFNIMSARPRAQMEPGDKVVAAGCQENMASDATGHWVSIISSNEVIGIVLRPIHHHNFPITLVLVQIA